MLLLKKTTFIKYLILFIGIHWCQSINAQNSNIKFIDLPVNFNTELEISGMVGHDNILYLVSEREEIIFLLDQNDYSIIKSIDLTNAIIDFNAKYPENEINIRKIEIEGTTWFKNCLYLVDEGNTSIYRFDLNEGIIRKLETNLDLSEFKGSYGMEGIAVNPDKKILYLLRERNGNNQSEIYILHLSEDDNLDYKNQKYTIDHKDNNWRYSDIYYDSEENMIFALRSYYDRSGPELAKCFIDQIPVDKDGSLSKQVIFSNDETLSKKVIENRCKYVSNLEGIFKIRNKIFIVSDNARSTKDCEIKPIKTMFIEYIISN